MHHGHRQMTTRPKTHKKLICVTSADKFTLDRKCVYLGLHENVFVEVENVGKVRYCPVNFFIILK